MASLDKVYDIVRKEPVLPVEVASKLGVDSFLARAYLTQLVDSGKIRITQETVVGIPVYFVSGQELLANSKIKKLVESSKPTPKTFAPPTQTGKSPEIDKKRAEFKARLEEIEKREQLDKERKAKARPKPKPKLVKPKEPEVPDVGEEPEPVTTINVPITVGVEAEIEEPKQEARAERGSAGPSGTSSALEKPKPSLLKAQAEQSSDGPSKIVTDFAREAKKFITGEPSSLVDTSLAWLSGVGASIENKELRKRGKEATIIANVPSGIGKMKFLIFVINKKTISESDLSLAYSEGVQKKLPVLILSRGKLSKIAQNYKQVISGVVKFKQLE